MREIEYEPIPDEAIERAHVVGEKILPLLIHEEADVQFTLLVNMVAIWLTGAKEDERVDVFTHFLQSVSVLTRDISIERFGDQS